MINYASMVMNGQYYAAGERTPLIEVPVGARYSRQAVALWSKSSL